MYQPRAGRAQAHVRHTEFPDEEGTEIITEETAPVARFYRHTEFPDEEGTEISLYGMPFGRGPMSHRIPR